MPPSEIPPCAAAMGCLCAGHARGDPASAECNTDERSLLRQNARSVQLKIMLTEKERERLADAAFESGMNVSGYMRHAMREQIRRDQIRSVQRLITKPAVE